MPFKTSLTFILTSLFLFASTGNAANQCHQLFHNEIISHQDHADQKQFLINYHKRLTTTFITRGDVARYFHHDLNSISEYTKGTKYNYKDFNEEFGNPDLNIKMNAVKFRNEMENSLFSRASFQGTVYSGGVFQKDYIDPLIVIGKNFSFGYFRSTSKNRYIADGFAEVEKSYLSPDDRKVIFTIDSKRGKPVSDISYYPDENEVLFSSTAEFTITGVKDGVFGKTPVRYVTLTEANPKISENFNIQIKETLTTLPAELSDWKKGLEYIFANSRSISLNVTDLKRIHQISTEHLSFEKSKQRSQLISAQQLTTKYSGHFRSSDADYLIANGNHVDPGGQRYFKPNEIEGYINNPFFFIQNIKKKSEHALEADAHFVVPREIQEIVNMVLTEGQIAISKSNTNRLYVLNIFKLYKALISIHPFSDGNNRSIRLFIYSHLLKKNLPIEYFPTLSAYENTAAQLAQEYVDGNQLTSRELN